MTSKAFLIPEVKINELKKNLDRMAKRAQKLGLTECGYSVGAVSDVPYLRNSDGSTRCFTGTAEQLVVQENEGRIVYHRYVEVTVSGPAPVLAGWTFAATLQHLTDDQGKIVNVIRTNPDLEGQVPTTYRSAAPCCDHCQTIRNRKDTYLVRNVATGTWKQIGSSCMKDFLGGNDPYQVAGILAWFLDAAGICQELSEDGEGGEGGSCRADCYSLREFLAYTAAVIRTEGWMSRARAENEQASATVDLVLQAIRSARQAPASSSSSYEADCETQEAARHEARSF